jgi:serine/threonine-protein kinase
LADLRVIREAKEAQDKAAGKREMTLIEELMAEELANFRSIDDEAAEEHASSTGSRSLLDDDFDSSAPLVEGLDDLLGPGHDDDHPMPPPRASATPSTSISSPLPRASSTPIPTAPEDLPDADEIPTAAPETQIARTRLPSPPPRETKSNAGIWVLIILILLGGGVAAAWYLKLIPGL